MTALSLLQQRPVREAMIAIQELQAEAEATSQAVTQTLALTNGQELVEELDRRSELLAQALEAEVAWLGQDQGLAEHRWRASLPYELLGLEPDVMDSFGGSATLTKLLKLARYDWSQAADLVQTIKDVMSYADTVNQLYLDHHGFLMRVLATDKDGYHRGERYTLSMADTISQAKRYPWPPQDYPADERIAELWRLMSDLILATDKRLRSD